MVMSAQDPNVDIVSVMEMIPHRYPILLVDRILEYVAGERAVGLKNVTFNEPHFQGHFPGWPVMPGVLIIEGMAQTAGAICCRHIRTDELRTKQVFFMTIDKCKFRRMVVPGDRLELEVEIKREIRNMTLYTCNATVDGQQVACAEILCAEVDA